MTQKNHRKTRIFKLSFLQILFYALYAFRGFIAEHQKIFFPILIAGIFKILILKLLISFSLSVFLYFFFKFCLSSQNFEENEKIFEKRDNFEKTAFFSKTSIFAQIYDKIFGKKSMRKTAKITNSLTNLAQNPEKSSKFPRSLIKDSSFFHNSSKNPQNPANFLLIFSQKILVFLKNSLKSRKSRAISHIYLQKIVKNSIKEQKSLIKPSLSPQIPQGSSSSQIFHISKQKPSISSQKDQFSSEIVFFKKKTSITSKSAILRNFSSQKTVVSFDVPSSQRQSAFLQFSKRRPHFSRSLSLKKLKEKQIPSFLLEKYNLVKNDAEKAFERLGISKEISGFNEKSREWVIEEMVYKVFRRNIENIIDINKILEANYRKTLKEFEVFYENRTNENKDKSFEFISIEELINWKKNQCLWRAFSTNSKEEIRKIQGDLLNLIEDRENLDVELGVQGYEVAQIRFFLKFRFF